MSADSFRNSNHNPRCPAIGDQLFEYVDSSLSAAEMRAVDSHLAACERCRVEVEQIRRAESALIAAPLSIPPPGDLYLGFAEKLAARRPMAPTFRLQHLAPALALGMLVVLLFRSSHLSENRGMRQAGTVSPPNLTASANAPGIPRKGMTRRHSDNPSDNPIVAFAARNNHETLRAYRSEHIRTEKRSSESHVLDVAFSGELRSNRRKRTAGVVLLSVNGADNSDDLGLVKSKSALDLAAQYSSLADSEQQSARSYYYDLAYAPQPASQPLGLSERVPAISTAATEQRAAPEFALVVQDDVRGFTAEAHNTTISTEATMPARVGNDDGIKIEVEFDGADGASSF